MSLTEEWRYIIGISEGRTVLMGPYPLEPDSTADTLAMEKFSPDSFEIFKYKSRDNARVTQQLKEGKIRLENQTIKQALERIKHK